MDVKGGLLIVSGIVALSMSLYIVYNKSIPAAVPKQVSEFIVKEINCLENNIHYEADGEPFIGKLAVGMVTVNRAKLSGKSLCDTVYEPNQFSWTLKPRNLNARVSPDTKLATLMVLNNTVPLEYLSEITYFHNTTVSPKWAKNKREILSIGGHKFYAE